MAVIIRLLFSLQRRCECREKELSISQRKLYGLSADAVQPVKVGRQPVIAKQSPLTPVGAPEVISKHPVDIAKKIDKALLLPNSVIAIRLRALLLLQYQLI